MMVRHKRLTPDYRSSPIALGEALERYLRFTIMIF
jgi:hypothetical protein